MLDADTASVVMDFHEYYPKDRLHAELVSIRDPWNEQLFLARFWRDDRPCVFDNLTRRMRWPESACFVLWKKARERHYASWGQVASAVGGRYKRRKIV